MLATRALMAASTATASDAETQIAETILGADAASITFSSIPQGYAHLRLVVMGRVDTIGNGGENLLIRFNSDSGSNYDHQRLRAFAATVQAIESLAGTSGYLGEVAGNPATSAVATETTVIVYDYSRTSWQKCYTAQGQAKRGIITANLQAQITSGWWRSAAAITAVTLLPSAGNFVAGMVATLYGIKGE